MRPDLVLDDEDKRRRFKHSKIGGRKKSENCKVTSTHYKSNKKQMLYVYGHTAQNLPQPTKPPIAETPDTDEEDTEPLLLDLEDVERIHSQLRHHESCIDPETGLDTAGRAVSEGSRSFHTVPGEGPYWDLLRVL